MELEAIEAELAVDKNFLKATVSHKYVTMKVYPF